MVVSVKDYFKVDEVVDIQDDELENIEESKVVLIDEKIFHVGDDFFYLGINNQDDLVYVFERKVKKIDVENVRDD